MHQQSRYPPRVSSPASSPQTNPTRTNNPRDAVGAGTRSRASSGVAAQDGPAGAHPETETPPAGPSRESVKKLDQIIQNFHSKAAVLILQSRVNTTPVAGSKKSDARKTNKWFQIETDEIDDFREELRVFKTCGSFENRPPPMIIETYLDASALSASQTLVVTDEGGKPWDVLEALNLFEFSSDGSSSSRSRKRHTDVVLERWRIELKCLPGDVPEDFGPTLPTIYKRSIVFFRSLFVAARVMPAWRHAQHSMTKSGHSALQVHCRFSFVDPEAGGSDLLRQPLYDGRDAVTDYMFGDLEVPVGRFYASVTYRNDCNFRVDDSEALLSSRFMGVDEQLFKPSLPQRHAGRRDSYTDMGSLPSRRQNRQQPEQQTYGSLSTFHGAGPLGTSPLSALRAIRPIGSDTSSPAESMQALQEPEPPHSLPIGGHSSMSRPPLRIIEGVARRPSVSFQPFKAGSLSGSPRINDGEPPPSPHSLARQSALGAIQQSRNRNSLTAGMAASLRGAPIAAPDATGSPSSRPASRYSSSFTHRRGRLSFGGASKAGDDDQGSSGKQSLSSSVQPGSGLLAEAAGTSSGSVQTDDENISEFLKILDSKKTLPSFESPSQQGKAAAKRAVAQLSKFQLMRDSNNALTESMTSSFHLQRSSGASSRQLTSNPGMVNPASLSTSSSPSKPLSPHTPHTPAVPSRLSENAIIDHQAQAAAHQRATTAAPAATQATSRDGSGGGAVPSGRRQEGTTAIDIPLSPRLMQSNRRASSVAQQHRALISDDDDALTDMPFAGNRSISLGADERGEPPTLSSLLGMETGSGGDDHASLPLQPPTVARPSPSIITGGVGDARSASSTEPEEGRGRGAGKAVAASPGYRLRYSGVSAAGRGSRSTGAAQSTSSSRGSFAGGGGGGSSSAASGRYGASRAGVGSAAGDQEADDEPLLFDMSELEREQGRRSLEEARGGGVGVPAPGRIPAPSGGSGGNGSERGGGGYESSTSAARGARRGW